jgi:hypothetical protein
VCVLLVRSERSGSPADETPGLDVLVSERLLEPQKTKLFHLPPKIDLQNVR